jgi:hypothetical protein
MVVAAETDAGRVRRSRITMQSNSASILQYVAFNKDAFPNRQHQAGWTKSFSLPKQAQVFSRKFPSAISGFRSLCGREQRSSIKPSRST